jgi:hypothetical protein
MNTLELYQRETHTYTSGWSHLDQWEHIGTAKMLQQRMTREPDGHDDGGTYIAKVIAPRNLKGRDISRAIANSLGGSSCRHEHDCCGCPSTSASVKRTSPREYSVHLRVSFNY